MKCKKSIRKTMLMKLEDNLKPQTLIHKKGKGKSDDTIMHVGVNRETCWVALEKMIVKNELSFKFVLENFFGQC